MDPSEILHTAVLRANVTMIRGLRKRLWWNEILCGFSLKGTDHHIVEGPSFNC